jgi:hypothetical protein
MVHSSQALKTRAHTRWCAALLLCAGCAPEATEIHWGLDTITLRADGDDVVGTQSWALFDPRWERGQRNGRQVCSAEVSLTGVPIEGLACGRCDNTWDLTVELTHHDCDEAQLATLDALTGITGVGLGELAPRLVEISPRDGAMGGWVRYPERGWIAHGWAGPTEFWDGALRDASWEATRPFLLEPAFAWELAVP